ASRAITFEKLVIIVLTVFNDFGTDSIDIYIPFPVAGVAQFDLVDVLTIVILQFGINDIGAGVQVKCDLVQFLEMLDGALFHQFDGFVGAQIISQGGSGNGSSGGENSSQDNSAYGFHGLSPDSVWY